MAKLHEMLRQFQPWPKNELQAINCAAKTQQLMARRFNAKNTVKDDAWGLHGSPASQITWRQT